MLANLDCEGCGLDCDEHYIFTYGQADPKKPPMGVDELPCCPIRWIEARPVSVVWANYCAIYADSKAMPSGGGVNDQPAAFWLAWGAYGGELGRIDRFIAEQSRPRG